MSEQALVVGLGLSGVGAARHLRDVLGYEVRVVDDAETGSVSRRADELIRAGVDVRLGLGLRLDRSGGAKSAENSESTSRVVDELLYGCDLLVPSPGVPPAHPILVEADRRGIPMWGEVELAFRSCRCPVVAVTGTNGKTTVATLIRDMLAEASIPTLVCGNIGTPMISVVDTLPSDGVMVVEVSSFQLMMTDVFRARVGVFLNLAPDHLDWHLTAEGYEAAKRRIWANQTEVDLALAYADDPVTCRAIDSAPGRHAFFSTSGVFNIGVGVRDGILVVCGIGPYKDETEILAVTELGDGGPVDVANAAAATAAVCDLGVTPDVIAAVLRDFKGLPHRRRIVGRRDGVTWVNDSKATNPHAAIAAIRSYPRVVLIAGGRNKGLDLGQLAEVSDHVVAVVAIGEAAGQVAKAFAGTDVPVHMAADMKTAVGLAAQTARLGDTVLLSPACASFDWYESYRARGKAFVAEARRIGISVVSAQ